MFVYIEVGRNWMYTNRLVLNIKKIVAMCAYHNYCYQAKSEFDGAYKKPNSYLGVKVDKHAGPHMYMKPES